MLKKIFESKILRIVAAAILIYLAFQRVNIWSVLSQLAKVPLWFVIVNVIYGFFVSMLGAYRWGLLLFDKPNLREVLTFTRANYMGGFYALFLPSSMAGDLIKWVPIHKKYPEIGKAKLLSSVLIDRVVGFTAFILVAFVSAVIGKLLNFNFPNYLFLVFMFLFIGTIVFYVLVFNFDIGKLLEKIPFLNKLVHVVDLLKKENKKRIIRCLLVSFVCEFAWFCPVWLISLVFGTGFSLLSVFIFMPIISLLLILPISVAGFGGREYLFLFFFSQIGIADEKILLVSAFIGLIGILNSVIGGVWSFFKI